MKATTDDARKLIHEGILALNRASEYGMYMDVPYIKKTQKILNLRIKKSTKLFFQTETGKVWKKVHSNPNITSDHQLREVLFDKLKLKPLKETKKGNKSVDLESLKALLNQCSDLQHLLDLKKIDKISGTYMEGFLKETVDGIMHPFFTLHTVITYRSSSQNPNFQNLPNRDKEQKTLVRKAILPRPGGQIVTADFGGIEVAKSCCVHKDPTMIHDYIEGDMHRDMAIEIFKLDSFQKSGTDKILRKGAKNGFVFPQFYGDYYGNNAPILFKWANLPTSGRISEKDGLILSTGQTIGAHLISKGIKTFNQFENHIKRIQDDFWNVRYKVYKRWKIQNVENYLENGYLKTLTGFTCSGLLSVNDINNYPIQSIAFHSLLRCFIEMDKRLKKEKLKTRIFGQIHDEMVFNSYPEEIPILTEMIKDVCCYWLRAQCPWIIVPMEIEMSIFGVDKHWASESETIKLN